MLNVNENVNVKERPPVHMLVRMTNEIKGYSFKVGDVLAASEVGTQYNSCYYLYDPVSFKFRGCMVKEAFELLETNLTAPEITEKAREERRTVTRIVEPDAPETYEQTSIFDFLQ
jgi:hypothetical protein